jgi:zinc/manganese transport system permease protein
MMELFTNPDMKRALAGALALSFGAAPLGVFLVLRRMSLMGDVMAHAILPGVAAGFLMAGMSVSMMTAGGFVAGLAIALFAGLATRFTVVREDASLAAFYLMAVAVGILMIASRGDPHELIEILFGDASSIDNSLLILMASISSATMAILAIIYRPLIVESFDPVFMRSVRGNGGLYHILFLMLVVLNMIAGYRTLGTLMSAGLMLIPAITAQFWTRRLLAMILLAVGLAIISSVTGLCIAVSAELPSGPAIITVAGVLYILSLFVGRYGSIRARYFPARHLEI